MPISSHGPQPMDTTRPGQILKHYELEFCHEGLTKDPRELKSSPDFIQYREEVLSLIWGMEEETVAHSA